MSSIKEHSKSSCWYALGNVLIQGIGYQRENKHSFIHSFPGFARNQRSSRSLLPCLHTIWHLTNIVKQCFSETLSTTNKALAKRTCKSMQVHASVQNQDCVKTCDGWPNGFASPLTSPLKSHKAVNVTYTETCDQLVLTCAGWPNSEKILSTCIQIWARPKSMQIDTSGWPNEK